MMSASVEDRDREQEPELLRDPVGAQDERGEDRAHDDRGGDDHAADRRDAVLDRLRVSCRPWTCSSRIRLIRKTM